MREPDFLASNFAEGSSAYNASGYGTYWHGIDPIWWGYCGTVLALTQIRSLQVLPGGGWGRLQEDDLGWGWRNRFAAGA